MLYRFCFLDAQDRIAVQEEIEAKSLMDAIARAHMLLQHRPHYPEIEVWAANARVYRGRRDRAA